jgi:predicted metal-dependent hydrolase
MNARTDAEADARSNIPRRSIDFTFDAASVPLDWCRNDTYLTTLLETLSLLFPEGERFFVDSVKTSQKRVTSPELLLLIAGFIGQEAMHGKEHRAFNEFLLARGLAVGPTIDRRLRGVLKTGRRIFSPASQLAITAALEHFTAILAEALLRDARLRENIHLSVRPLWLWHALEESEHKAVAFDVYRAAGNGYLRRVAIMLVVTVLFFTIVAIFQVQVLATRGVLSRPWRLVPGLVRGWIWPGYFIRLLPAYLAYYRPGFHPDDRDTRALLADWRDRLFGDQGELVPQLRSIA